MTDAAESTSDGAAARKTLARMRRNEIVSATPLVVVFVAESAIATSDGERGWGVFWLVLFALCLVVFFRAVRVEGRRVAFLMRRDEETALRYCRARLDRGVELTRGKGLGTYAVVGAAFTLLGVLNLSGNASSRSTAAGDFVIGAYFIGVAVYRRFVLGPRLEAERARIGGVSLAPTDPAVPQLARELHADSGKIQAVALWRELTGASFGDSRRAVEALQKETP